VRLQQPTPWQPAIGSGQTQMDMAAWPTGLRPDLRAERDAIIEAHHNLLLVGTPSATNGMLASLEPHLRHPLQQYKPKIGAPLPREGTLVVLEVARLDLAQQRKLLQWLDRFREGFYVQVVSTTCEPLFSLVETGAFLPELYYRLNVLRIELTGSGEEDL